MTTDPSTMPDGAGLGRVASDAARAAGHGFADELSERMARWVGGRAGAQAVFGEPVRNGDTVVVPVARSRWAVGGGGGGGETEGEPESPARSGSGYGSGGGGGVISDPVGYLEIRPDGAVFRPIGHRVSPGVIIAGGIATAIVLRALARLLRG